MEGLAWGIFRDIPLLQSLYGSNTFAWNEEWLGILRHLFPNQKELLINFHLSVLLVFIFSPIIIRSMGMFVPMTNKRTNQINFTQWYSPGVILTILATGVSLWFKQTMLTHLFLFDFVISMGIGIFIGIIFRIQNNRVREEFVSTIQDLGTLSLYGSIVSMLLISTSVTLEDWDWFIVGLLVVKFLVITIIYVLFSRRWVKNHHQLALMSACWAFTLSAPVVCMNAMRSVVYRHDEADDVLLLVPPIILWLVNYSHYGIFVWFYGL